MRVALIERELMRRFCCLSAAILAAGLAFTTPLRAEDMSDTERLHALFDAEWEWTMRENPDWASSLGDPRYNDRWPDVGLAAIERRHEHRLGVLETLETIDRAKLSPSDRLNYTLFHRNYALDVEGHPYQWRLVPLTARDGIQDAGSLADALPFTRVKDYEDWIARMRAFPTYMEQTIALMREGVRQKRLQPRVVMRRVPSQIRRQIVEDPAESLFFKPFRSFPEDVTQEERDRLIGAAKAAIAENVVPAYRAMLTFFEQEYLPACFEEVGVWQVPNGKEFYAFRCRRFTTTDLTPREIHEIGLAEVERIRGEMEAVIEQAGFEGSFAEFLEHLRTDPKFYYEDAGELLEAYRAVSKKIDPQ
ncbi:MAG: DUF885 domain-containing protein, partial [Planctomycetaceae bacterium]